MTRAFDHQDAVRSTRSRARGGTALLVACRWGDLIQVDILLRQGHSPDSPGEQGFRPLHVASAMGHLEVVVRLLAAGANLEASSSHPGCFGGQRPLHAAVGGDHLDVVDLLLSKGAEVDAPDETGFTALHVATMHGSLAVVRRLLCSDADPRREVADASPVTLAKRRGDAGITAVLRQCARMGRLRVD